MKQITVKIPDKLEKSFNDLVRIEFAGNVNQAVVSILAEKLKLKVNGVSEIEELRFEVNRIKKVLRDKGLEL